MKNPWKIWPLLLAVGLLPWLFWEAATRPVSIAPSGKIAPWVLDHTADGAQTEFLVVLEQQANLSRAETLSTKLEKGRYVYRTLWNTAQTTQAPLIAWLKVRGVEYRSYYIVNLIWVKADRAVAEALAARSDVARIVGNPSIRAIDPQPIGPTLPDRTTVPASIELGISHVHAPEVWAMGFTGQGIVIGGQDTGIQWDHPALKNHYRGWNSATLTVTHDYNWHDSIHTNTHGTNSCGADSPAPCDDSGHGTHTIGTAVGDDGGANQIGMAPGAKFIGCRNMDNGWGTAAQYMECFEFFLAPYPVGGTPDEGNPDFAPDVTNNSWSCPKSTDYPPEDCDDPNVLLSAVEAQRAAGIMTVASAGNEGSGCSTVIHPPGMYDPSYTVGALTTGTDSIASFSSRGPVTRDGSNRRKPDISAPGTSTRSAIPTNAYTYMSGTSMASPHVAGAVALLWSARPWLKNQIAATEDILNTAAVHISSTACSSSGWPNNTYGYGRLDVKAAVDATQLGGHLQGMITDKQATSPLVGASVDVATGAQHYLTTTIAGGLYSLNVTAGTYTVTTTAVGYMPYITTGLEITTNQTVTLNIALEVTPTYVITGYVRDAYSHQPLSAQINLSGTGHTASTNLATGYYSLTAQIPNSAYHLIASAPRYGTQSRSITLNQSQQQDFDLAPICLLVIDDDGGQNYDAYYTSALTQLGMPYDRVTTAPDLTTLAQYDGVIWLTGVSGAISEADQAELSDYLNGGGRLFMSGQDIGQQIGTGDFYPNYLHAQYQTDHTGIFTLTGQSFLSGLDVTISGGGGANNQLYPDGVAAQPDGVPVYKYVGSPLSGGVAYSGTYRTVYFSFGYEAINSASERSAVMSATLNYLGVCGMPQAPQANIEITGTQKAGEQLVFFNTSRGSPFMTYEWDFGDGITSTLAWPYVKHTYADGGDYTVTLTANNPFGESIFSQLLQIANVYRVYLPLTLK
jgi:subtilisin family serine protease